MKRGISPLIASVMLIGFALIIGIAVITWGTGTFESVQTRADDWASAELMRFSAYPYSSADCQVLCGTDVKCETLEEDDCICVLIENKESMNVNYEILVKGDLGSKPCRPEDFELGPYESKGFAINIETDKIGQPPYNVRVDAVIPGI